MSNEGWRIQFKAGSGPSGLEGGRLLREPYRVTAGFLVRPQREEPAFLRIGQEVVERAEAVKALVESGLAAFDGLLDHRAPDGLVFAALLGHRVQRLDHQIERIRRVGGFVLRRSGALGGRAPGARSCAPAPRPAR